MRWIVPDGGRADNRKVEDWEEQVRAVLTDQERGQTDTPESSAWSSFMQPEWSQEQVMVKNRDDEDNDWMWGGMNGFGGGEPRQEGKALSVPMHEGETTHRSKRSKR